MHYKLFLEDLDKEIVIKSENAAKSALQRNKHFLQFIECIPREERILDYGCGKLRYTLHLLNRGNKVVAVDSNIQLSRKQKIDSNFNTSIIDIKEKYSKLEIYSAETFDVIKGFDWAICSNVLSAIPSKDVRLEVLKKIKKSLNPGGKLILSLQYRNSYFSSYTSRNSAIKYEDGYIIENRGNYTFYGIISPENVKTLCESLNFKLLEEKKIDGTIILKLENT